MSCSKHWTAALGQVGVDAQHETGNEKRCRPNGRRLCRKCRRPCTGVTHCRSCSRRTLFRRSRRWIQSPHSNHWTGRTACSPLRSKSDYKPRRGPARRRRLPCSLRSTLARSRSARVERANSRRRRVCRSGRCLHLQFSATFSPETQISTEVLEEGTRPTQSWNKTGHIESWP